VTEGKFVSALQALMEDLEYEMYVQITKPLYFQLPTFGETVERPEPMTRQEWWTHRHQLHPTRQDLNYHLMPEQVYLFPENYEWWCLPEEGEDD
jgi:hypothetical protein